MAHGPKKDFPAIDLDSIPTEPTKAEMHIMRVIAERYHLSDMELNGLAVLQVSMMMMGMGRNDQTVRILKAIIDVIESPILSYEEEQKPKS